MCSSSSKSSASLSFHLSASVLALVALVGAYSTAEATASVSSLGIPTPIESSMAMYYQPGVADVANLCPPDYVGAYIAAGCESIIWCADGMLKFQAGCPEEGQLFDDTCLCCRDADEFECRVEASPQVEVEEQTTAAVEVEVDEETVEADSAVIIDDIAADQADCIRCTNIPTEYMLKNGVTCATYEHAFTRRCGTEFGWWGRNGNPEHCQYSCDKNDVPYASQRGRRCCQREETDDLDLAAKLFGDDIAADATTDTDATIEEPTISAVEETPVDQVASSSVCEADFTGLTTNEDCTSISVCNNGELATSMACPTGTLFDDNSKKCVKWHRQFVCTKSQMEAGTVETVENSSECPRGASGLHPLADCVGYNVCFLGTKLFETPCTTGTLFNVNTQQCECWHRGFVCGGTLSTRAEAPTAAFTPTSVPTAGPTASPTKEPTPVAEPVDEVQIDSTVSPKGTCPAGLTGFIPTPDCRGSNVCRNGVFKYAIECKDGHLFDSDKGRCVKWHRKFVCGGDSEESISGDSNGEELPSPTGSPTGAPTGSPTGAPTGSPTRAPVAYVCPEDYTGMLATTGCRGSYVCRAGKYLMGPIPCPSGMMFDEAFGFCVDRTPWVSCSTGTEAGTRAKKTDAPTSSPVEEDVGPCQSGFTGLAPTEQCTGANVCRGGEFIMSMDCPGGSLFDASIQQCVPWYRSFVCGDVAEDSATSEVEVKGAGRGKKSDEKEDDIVPDEAKTEKGEKDDASKDSRDKVSMDTVDPPVPPTTPAMRPRSRCPRGFTGKVPANEACSSYIFCERGQYDNHGVVNCRPEQFVFDFLTQKCVMPYRSFECMYTVLTTDEEAIAQELIAQVKAGQETVSDGEEEIAQETLAKVKVQSVPLSGGSGRRA